MGHFVVMLGSLFHFLGDMLGDVWAYFGDVFGRFWGGVEKKFGRGREMLENQNFQMCLGAFFQHRGI